MARSINDNFPKGWKTVAVHKFGQSGVVSATAAAQDVWSAGDTYNWPTEATVCYVLSDLGVDQGSATGAGSTSGAWNVEIQGLDGDFNYQTETVVLNGTATAETSLSYYRIFRAAVKSAGVAESNRGTISVYQQQSAGAGGDIKLAEIPSDTGQTLMAIYTVPALSGRDRVEFYGWKTWLSTKGSQPATVSLEMRENGGAWQTKDLVGVTSANGSIEQIYANPLQIAPKTDIRVRIPPSGAAGAAAIGASFDLMFSKQFTKAW